VQIHCTPEDYLCTVSQINQLKRKIMIDRINPPKYKVGKFTLNEYELRSLQLKVCTGEVAGGIKVRDERNNWAEILPNGNLSVGLYGMDICSAFAIQQIKHQREMAVKNTVPVKEDVAWRRVSTDEKYIICKRYCGFFIEGTQSSSKIHQLLDYIVNTSSYKGYFKTYDPSDLEIVDNTVATFNRIQNKHWFTDQHSDQLVQYYKSIKNRPTPNLSRKKQRKIGRIQRKNEAIKRRKDRLEHYSSD